MVAVLTYGANLYDAENWRHVEGAKDRYFAALRRHLREARNGKVLDDESGLLVLAHVATCAHFLLGLALAERPDLARSLDSKRLPRAVANAKKIRAKRRKALDDPSS